MHWSPWGTLDLCAEDLREALADLPRATGSEFFEILGATYAKIHSCRRALSQTVGPTTGISGEHCGNAPTPALMPQMDMKFFTGGSLYLVM